MKKFDITFDVDLERGRICCPLCGARLTAGNPDVRVTSAWAHYFGKKHKRDHPVSENHPDYVEYQNAVDLAIRQAKNRKKKMYREEKENEKRVEQERIDKEQRIKDATITLSGPFVKSIVEHLEHLIHMAEYDGPDQDDAREVMTKLETMLDI